MATDFRNSGIFAQPAPQQSRGGQFKENLAYALMGRLPERIDQRRQEDALMSQERQQAMVQDAMSVYQMLGSGRYDDAISLMDRRVQLIGQLGGDPSDTLALRQQVISGDLQGAMGELQQFLGAAQQAGLIPGAQTIKPADLVDGELVQIDPIRGTTRQRITAAPTDRDPIAALRARASEAGLRPGTPEYQEFMAQGGRSPAGDPARERQIADLMETFGMTRQQAIGSMMERTLVDPVTGNLMAYNPIS